MELSPWLIYVILQMDTFIVVCMLLMVFVPVFTGIAMALCPTLPTDMTDTKLNIFPIKIGGTILGIAFLLLMFLPSTKTLTAMYVLPAIVSNEDIQALPSELAKAVRTVVKEWTVPDTVQK